MSEHWDGIAGEGPVPGSSVALNPPPYQVQNVDLVEGSNGSYLQSDLRVTTPGTYNVQWFFYDATANPANATAQQAITFTDSVEHVTLPIGSLSQGHTYKASIGLFDQSNHLVKWFDSLAVLKLQGGVPQIQKKAVEDPCGQQVQSANN
jgi:hypothetical protein